MKTRQEIFNQVAEHLMTQGAQSVIRSKNLERICAYRGDGGLKCAIGCLIPDDYYSPDMEGAGVFENVALLRVLITVGIYHPGNALRLRFLLDLQDVHDESFDFDDEGGARDLFRRRLCDFSIEHHLEIPPCLN